MQNSNFESKDELQNSMSQFELHTVNYKGNLHKIKLVTFQTYVMNEIFNFFEFFKYLSMKMNWKK